MLKSPLFLELGGRQIAQRGVDTLVNVNVIQEPTQLAGSSTSNRGHEHHRATSALVAREGRPRRLGGFQGGGGTRKDNSSLTGQR